MPVADADGAALVTAMIEEMREPYLDVGGPSAGGLGLNSPDMPKAEPAKLATDSLA